MICKCRSPLKKTTRELTEFQFLMSRGDNFMRKTIERACVKVDLPLIINTSNNHLIFRSAPQVILDGQYTHGSDVWAFGILAWELYTSFAVGQQKRQFSVPYHELKTQEEVNHRN